jgi:hypothetical protein
MIRDRLPSGLVVARQSEEQDNRASLGGPHVPRRSAFGDAHRLQTMMDTRLRQHLAERHDVRVSVG